METINAGILPYSVRLFGIHLFYPSDLDDASDCDPAIEEEDGPGPKPKGADKRRKARDLKTAATPCKKGFVCRQVGFMQYQCSEEPDCKLIQT